MHIRQELLEVFTSIAIRNYYCYLEKWTMEKIKDIPKHKQTNNDKKHIIHHGEQNVKNRCTGAFLT